MKLKTALFDFDGVIANTEPLYDQFWNKAPLRYGLRITEMAQKIKGLTLMNILDSYFRTSSEQTRKQVWDDCIAFEKQMDFPPVKGVLSFLQLLKGQGVKIAIVTSSGQEKMNHVFEVMKLEGLYDLLVTGDQIKKGKPAPDCFLLAAKKLESEPEDCVVFEDSYNGIKAGLAAQMRVVGLSTSNPEEKLKKYTDLVIPDFDDFTIEQYAQL